MNSGLVEGLCVLVVAGLVESLLVLVNALLDTIILGECLQLAADAISRLLVNPRTLHYRRYAVREVGVLSLVSEWHRLSPCLEHTSCNPARQT